MFKTQKFIRKLLKIKYIELNLKNDLHLLHSKSIYLNVGHMKVHQRQDRIIFSNLRVHSTQSDQHRQKAVIETSTPKIVIDKLRLGNVLPLEKKIEYKKEFWRDRFMPYAKLARWDKPIGIYLLYWPCAWSIALGTITSGAPIQNALEMAALFLIGAGLMRGAGCTVNDMWDRDIDALVERTKDRPLVSGAVTQTGATVFLAAQLSLALAVLLQLNCYSVVLGASSMLLVVTYPLAKRFTNYPQIFLGATFNWGALLGFTAIQGSMNPSICLPLYFGALAWTVVYDTIYAHQDKLDDARIGIKSTALTFGSRTAPALALVLTGSGAGLTAAGVAAGLDPLYTVAVLAYMTRSAYQIYTLNTEDPSDCAEKFKSNSLTGLIIFLGILAGGYSTYTENRKNDRWKEHPEAMKSCVSS